MPPAHKQVTMRCDGCGQEFQRYPNAKVHRGPDYRLCGRLRRARPQCPPWAATSLKARLDDCRRMLNLHGLLSEATNRSLLRRIAARKE